jgi:hypothetical protein
MTRAPSFLDVLPSPSLTAPGPRIEPVRMCVDPQALAIYRRRPPGGPTPGPSFYSAGTAAARLLCDSVLSRLASPATLTWQLPAGAPVHSSTQHHCYVSRAERVAATGCMAARACHWLVYLSEHVLGWPRMENCDQFLANFDLANFDDWPISTTSNQFRPPASFDY